jgi:hypothetical protein
MATLEMVPLRRTLPTGRVTLRFPQPPINPTGELALMLELELQAVAAAGPTGTTPATTPKVADTVRRTDDSGETPARKGGEAR